MIALFIACYIAGIISGVFIMLSKYPPFHEKIWIARNFNGNLYIYCKKPERQSDYFENQKTDKIPKLQIPSELFKNVTWEHSPVKFEIKLKY